MIKTNDYSVVDTHVHLINPSVIRYSWGDQCPSLLGDHDEEAYKKSLTFPLAEESKSGEGVKVEGVGEIKENKENKENEKSSLMVNKIIFVEVDALDETNTKSEFEWVTKISRAFLSDLLTSLASSASSTLSSSVSLTSTSSVSPRTYSTSLTSPTSSSSSLLTLPPMSRNYNRSLISGIVVNAPVEKGGEYLSSHLSDLYDFYRLSENNNDKSGVGDDKSEVGDVKLEIDSGKLEVGDCKLESVKNYGGAKLVGVRQLLQGEGHKFHTDPFFLAPRFLEGLKVLGEKKLLFDICAYRPQLSHVTRMVASTPETRYVIDHIGKPFDPQNIKESKTFSDWSLNIKRLSEFPNVFCKLSPGFLKESLKNYNESRLDLESYIRHVISCFGYDRLMFGSDWFFSSSCVNFILKMCDKLGATEKQRQQLFSENANNIYCLS